jgi:hypothetical protein
MTRDQIAETTYEAMIQLNNVKTEAGVINQNSAAKISFGLQLSRDIMRKIDEIIASTKDPAEREGEFEKLRHEIEDAKRSTGYAKRELRMPGTAGIRLKGALKFLLRLGNKEK